MEYSLTEKELAFVKDCQQAITEYQRIIGTVQQRIEGALSLIIRQQELEGDWVLVEDKLVKKEEPKDKPPLPVQHEATLTMDGQTDDAGSPLA